jgi:hypothetical protein
MAKTTVPVALGLLLLVATSGVVIFGAITAIQRRN